jgi:hypothetical protein
VIALNPDTLVEAHGILVAKAFGPDGSPTSAVLALYFNEACDEPVSILVPWDAALTLGRQLVEEAEPHM